MPLCPRHHTEPYAHGPRLQQTYHEVFCLILPLPHPGETEAMEGKATCQQEMVLGACVRARAPSVHH